MSLKAKWLKKAGEAYTSYKDKRPVSTDGASKGCNYSGPRGSCPRPTITGSTFCDLHTCPTAGCPEPKSSQSPKCGTGCVLVQPPPVVSAKRPARCYAVLAVLCVKLGTMWT